MPQFDPTQLASWTSGQWTGEPTGALTGFGIDSRTIREGQVFVALRTPQRDGHDFLAQASAAGAAAALVSAFNDSIDLPQLVVADPQSAFQQIAREHRRQFAGKVIGITGSAGKTSTKNLLAAMLGERTLATAGNLNNHLGVPLTLTRLDSTHHDFAVIEAGISAPGEMALLAGMIEPDAAIVTLVDHAHTKDLGDLMGVAREKAILPAAVKETGDQIFPSALDAMAPFQVLSGTKVLVERVEVFEGAAEANQVNFFATHRTAETLLGIVAGEASPETYQMVRVSDGMAQNAVLAITMARRLRVETAQIQRGLSAWKPSAMRGEIREDHGRMVYLDCYNANPASMADALATFDQVVTDGLPRLYVLGGMEELGNESEAQHHTLGASLNLQANDRVFAIGTGAESLKAGAVEAGAGEEQITVLMKSGSAAETVAAWNGPVFIKGSRRYQLETLLADGAVAVL